MRVTTLEEYGVRCALQLAKVYKDGPFSAADIAKEEGISAEYVGKIMYLFRKAGIVRAERGNQGGFVLAIEPKKVSLKSIFQSLAGKKDPTEKEFCSHYSGNAEMCVHHKECSIRPVWSVLTLYFDSVLNSLNLEDLLTRESISQETVKLKAQAEATRLVGSLKGPRS